MDQVLADTLATRSLDAETCYRAYISKDRRFDGRFYTGVVTTGIYCRPVCPSPQPKRCNMRFFACAAAAEQAGFRACRRCRPDTAPGTPAWAGTSATVSRALKLIEEGALDAGSVESLAARMGLGGRQLRRLFMKHLGATPLSVATMRRLHSARILIDQTDVPIGRIALDAGFGSIRQFNHVVRRSFGKTPSELRRAVSRRRPVTSGRELVIHLPYRPPFEWRQILLRLSASAVPGVEKVTSTAYCRSVGSAAMPGVIEVFHDEAGHRLVALLNLEDTSGLIQIAERIRRLFDLGADPLLIDSELGRDRRIAPLIRRRPGLRIPGTWSGHEAAIWAVLEQEATPREVANLVARIAARFGTPMGSRSIEGIEYLFPDVDRLAAADWDRIPLPDPTRATLDALIRAIGEELPLDASDGLERIVGTLMAIPGIAEHTAHLIAMRACGETDALPVTRRLRAALTNASGIPSVREVERMAQTWRPWRAYGALYAVSGGAAAVHCGIASSAGRGFPETETWRRLESL